MREVEAKELSCLFRFRKGKGFAVVTVNGDGGVVSAPSSLPPRRRVCFLTRQGMRMGAVNVNILTLLDSIMCFYSPFFV